MSKSASSCLISQFWWPLIFLIFSKLCVNSLNKKYKFLICKICTLCYWVGCTSWLILNSRSHLDTSNEILSHSLSQFQNLFVQFVLINYINLKLKYLIIRPFIFSSVQKVGETGWRLILSYFSVVIIYLFKHNLYILQFISIT